MQRNPIQLGNFAFKRAKIEQYLKELTRRHQFWESEEKKYNMEKPTSQSINVFKGLLLNLQRLSDLLLYQSFCFSKIAGCVQGMLEEIELSFSIKAKDCNITSLVAMLKKFMGKNMLSSNDQFEFEQYCNHIEAKNQVKASDKIYKNCSEIYSLMMISSGKRALEQIAISISHQEKVNMKVQALEKSLPKHRQSEEELQKVSGLFASLTIYGMQVYAEYYEREWIRLRQDILTYVHVIEVFQNRPKQENLHHS